jgi:antitoxin (DNA-binding transcriptional repressor) of toxin-antitoxin stability system
MKVTSSDVKIRDMAPEALHVSETDLVRDLPALLDRIAAGRDVIVERDKTPFAVIRGLTPPRRRLSECIALLSEDSESRLDDTFAEDLRAVVDSRNWVSEPLAE